jgi:hypothetical protein
MTLLPFLGSSFVDGTNSGFSDLLPRDAVMESQAETVEAQAFLWFHSERLCAHAWISSAFWLAVRRNAPNEQREGVAPSWDSECLLSFVLPVG